MTVRIPVGRQRTDPWRFSGRMGWALRNHWRKSSQWFALSRKHAEIVLDDTYILDLFQRYCQNAWDNDLNRSLPNLLLPSIISLVRPI